MLSRNIRTGAELLHDERGDMKDNLYEDNAAVWGAMGASTFCHCCLRVELLAFGAKVKPCACL